MTAQLAVVPGPDAAPGDELAVLRGMLRPDFLARAGWDPVAQVQQENLDLRRHAEEREEELAAAREANRRLMTELNHNR